MTSTAIHAATRRLRVAAGVAVVVGLGALLWEGYKAVGNADASKPSGVNRSAGAGRLR